jgi:hypothetical protein
MYSSLELLRKEIADPYRSAFDTNVGDGETTEFKLAHGNVKSGTLVVYVGNTLQEENTDYTVDYEEGMITFSSAPADLVSVTADYKFSVFSDTELTEFLALENQSIDGAVLRCIDILLMDSARRFDYSAGKLDLKPSQVFENLRKLREIVISKIESSATGGGGVILADRTSSYYDSSDADTMDLSRADL